MNLIYQKILPGNIISVFAIIFISIILMTNNTRAQISEANYKIYDGMGNPATLNQIINSVGRSDTVFLGENHDDSTAHYLQAEILKKTLESYGKNKKVTLSMEMFERDVQIVLDEYLKDLITEKKFLDDSRPWNNYKTDYRPLVEYAKQNQLEVIAANAPRRYVNMVSRNGRDSLNQLSPQAKKWLAPLPYPQSSETYAKKFTDLMGGMPSNTQNVSKILESQTLWDATMAFSIAEYLKNNKNALVVHLNGSFHTESRLGTAEQLLKINPKLKVLVITIKYEEDFNTFDKAKHTNLGDFIILTDAKVPRSFK